MGKLVQVDSWEYSTDVSEVILTGIDSDDVYMLVTIGIKSNSTAEALALRFAESGTLNATANYDTAWKELNVGSAFTNIAQTNYNEIRFGATVSGNNWDNAIHYIYNAYNSSEYTFVTNEGVRYGATTPQGRQGGAVFTVASQVNGVGVAMFNAPTKLITGGKMALYKVL